MPQTTRRLLTLAIERFGREELGKRLKTSPGTIDAWSSGQDPVPSTKLLAVIDLLDHLGSLGDEPASPKQQIS